MSGGKPAGFTAWEDWMPGVLFLLRRKLPPNQAAAATQEVRLLFLAFVASGKIGAGDNPAAFVRTALESVVRRTTIGDSAEQATLLSRDGQGHEIASLLHDLRRSEVRLLSSIYLEGASPEEACGEHGVTEAQFRSLKRRLRSRYDQDRTRSRVAV